MDMNAWKLFLSEKKNKTLFYVVIGSLACILFIFLNFLTYNENRRGFEFNDPVLRLFSPRDLSLFTFLLTYLTALAGIIISLNKPEVFLKLLACYGIMTVIRMFCLYALPFDPPRDIIPLQDIFLRLSFYSGRDNLRDLFFSGHTATLFLFAFIFNERKLKLIFMAIAVTVGVSLIIQHVHYSVDVIAAPIFAFISVKSCEFLFRNYIHKTAL